MINTDCFAYVDEKTCSALKKIDCKGCSFYKTRTQNNREMTVYNGTTDIERICWKRELKKKNEDRQRREKEKHAAEREKNKIAKKTKYIEDKLDDLCVAIVRQAVDDWRYLHAGGEETKDCNFDELTEFFDNNCGGLLAATNIDEYKLFTFLLTDGRR